MNERIKELAKQATEEVFRNTPSFLVTNDMWQQKFAELIVRECCSIADEVERADTGMFVSWYLKAYFGDEE